jgi:hypothetical protein
MRVGLQRKTAHQCRAGNTSHAPRDVKRVILPNVPESLLIIVSNVRLLSGRKGEEYQSAKTLASIPRICGAYRLTGNCCAKTIKVWLWLNSYHFLSQTLSGQEDFYFRDLTMTD